MILNKPKDFLDKLAKYKQENKAIESAFINHTLFVGNITNDERLIIENQVFNKVHFKNISFDNIHFKSCEFLDCEFTEITAWSNVYEDCSFTNSRITQLNYFECDFIGTHFNGCMISYLLFSESSLSDLEFNYCTELLELYFGGVISSNVTFRNSHIAHTRFEPNLIGEENRNFIFVNSEITDCYFDNNNLSKSTFDNCSLNKSIFANCLLYNSTFSENNKTENSEFASIDLHTINRSEVINELTLRNVFGITEADIKSFTLGLCSDIVLQSVFISYSFKDKMFANRINEFLRSRGVLTFLWEKDAPAGRPLKRIMIESVQKYDRLLFIASEKSIKSKACQFELSEGRIKQDTNWSTVLFPIHIDQFLFELDKSDIKPKTKQDEYWNNITELREINSIDFSEFNKEHYDENKFEELASKLVNNLKIR